MVPSVGSEKIPSDTTGHRSRDLPTSSAVQLHIIFINILGMEIGFLIVHPKISYVRHDRRMGWANPSILSIGGTVTRLQPIGNYLMSESKDKTRSVRVT